MILRKKIISTIAARHKTHNAVKKTKNTIPNMGRAKKPANRRQRLLLKGERRMAMYLLRSAV